ncbi:MAG: sugar phosphate nucleotidyltransferase [Nitrososphaerota archaeon]|nr:sugar phosphate nucleotidyltransferase [Nitrososphaerota archaeon]
MDSIRRMRGVVGGILCGGYGKRLWPLTNAVPKVLLEISSGYTILDRQLCQLKNIGIRDVYLLAGYLHEKIKERYGEEWKGLRVNYFIEKEPGGTLYAINNLLKNVESDFYIVMNGDIVTDINLLRMMKNVDENNVSMAVTRLKSPYGIVNISENKIIGFEEKPELPYYINAGIYVISKKLKERFLAFERGDVEKLVFPSLAKEGLLKYYFEKNVLWYSVDSHKDLEAVRSEFLDREDMPWGYVKTIVLTEKYMVRRVYIMEDFSTPIYMHMEKDESLHVISGKGRILLEDREVQIKEGDIVRVRPGQKHSITALENLTLMEYSTPHPADRIEVK